QKVESSVGVEIRQRVSHAESMWLSDPLAGDVDEMAVAVVPVKVSAGEIAHDQQVQGVVMIQIDERRAVNATPAFRTEARSLSRVGEMAMTVVQQEVRRVTVIRVVKVGPQDLAEGGHLVLTQKHIQVAIVIDVTASQDHGVGQARAGRPCHSARLVEGALWGAFE